MVNSFVVSDKNSRSTKIKKAVLKRIRTHSLSKSNLIIVIGGDGFMLETLKKYNKYKKPFYGINSGNYGFLMNKFSKKTNYNKLIKGRLVSISPLEMSVKNKSNIIKKCLPKKNQLKNKIHPATKTFQAIRIYVNDELNELKTSLEKTLKILNKDGLILVVSFQSLEDRIVKDFFNHNSGKRWRSSRHYPELPDKLATQLKIITKKPILPSASEILENPRSRSAKLRVAQKI